jgi:hypothetical protein
MKENIPIAQKMDTEIEDPSNGKFSVSDSGRVEAVSNINLSGKKRPSDDESPNDLESTELTDMNHDVPTSNEIDTNLVENVVPDLDVNKENPDTEAFIKAEELVGKALTSQETEHTDPDVEPASTPTIDLQRPVKRARTAYFLFLEDHRAETQKQVRSSVMLVTYLVLFLYRNCFTHRIGSHVGIASRRRRRFDCPYSWSTLE